MPAPFLALLQAGIAAAAAATASANWSYWQIGSKTVWTPVPNLDLSVEVMYNKLEGAFGGLTGTAGAYRPASSATRTSWPGNSAPSATSIRDHLIMV